MNIKSGRRFKLEFTDLPKKEPFWFDTQEELDAMTQFLESCPIDGPLELKITEYGESKVVKKFFG